MEGNKEFDLTQPGVVHDIFAYLDEVHAGYEGIEFVTREEEQGLAGSLTEESVADSEIVHSIID